MPKSDPKSVVRASTKDKPNFSNETTARNINIDLDSVPTASYVVFFFLRVRFY